MQNNTNTIMNTGYALVGVGLTKLDQLVVGLSLITVGVLLQILVPILNKKGIDAQSGFNG